MAFTPKYFSVRFIRIGRNVLLHGPDNFNIDSKLSSTNKISSTNNILAFLGYLPADSEPFSLTSPTLVFRQPHFLHLFLLSILKSLFCNYLSDSWSLKHRHAQTHAYK